MNKCNEKCEVYSRVCGYFRPVKYWNKGKQQEFKDRKEYELSKKSVLFNNIILIGSLLAVLFTFGCSHNSISYGNGFRFETTINPQSYAFGVSFIHGKILNVCVRENVELQLNGLDSSNANANKENAVSISDKDSFKLKIGKQITGYYVDAVKAGVKPEQIEQYTNGKK